MATTGQHFDVSPMTITARVDRLPALTRKHYAIVTILGLIFMFDFVELNTMGFIAPTLQKEWGLTVEQLGLLTSTAFIGMFIGGLLGGRLSDRFGRKTILLSGVALFCVMSLLTVVSTGPAVFGVFRLLTGVGLQMVSGTVLVLVSESFPKAIRARIMAIVTGIACIAGPLLAIVALILVPMGLWRGLYVFGALGIIPGIIALRLLPESPRWLAVAGRGSAADAQLRDYEAAIGRKFGALPPLEFLEEREGGTGSEEKSSLFDIFRGHLIGRTIVASLVFCGLILASFGFSAWVIYILVNRGYPQTEALTFGLILSFGTILGALLSALYVDRVERKVNLIIVLVLLAIALTAFGFADSVPVVLAAGLMTTVLLQAASATIYAYVPEMFPVEVRGTGAGFANGIGRVAGIFSGIIVAAVIASFTVQGVFVYLPLVAIAMAVIAAFGPRIGVREAREAKKRSRAALSGSETAHRAGNPVGAVPRKEIR